jgi:hypothetical protein
VGFTWKCDESKAKQSKGSGKGLLVQLGPGNKVNLNLRMRGTDPRAPPSQHRPHRLPKHARWTTVADTTPSSALDYLKWKHSLSGTKRRPRRPSPHSHYSLSPNVSAPSLCCFRLSTVCCSVSTYHEVRSPVSAKSALASTGFRVLRSHEVIWYTSCEVVWDPLRQPCGPCTLPTVMQLRSTGLFGSGDEEFSSSGSGWRCFPRTSPAYESDAGFSSPRPWYCGYYCRVSV